MCNSDMKKVDILSYICFCLWFKINFWSLSDKYQYKDLQLKPFFKLDKEV